MKKPLVVLTGPTAAGKTGLSLRLAKEIGGEIISADSMQVYREMNIGTAKIEAADMQGIPHHLIDILDPWESFNVTEFVRLAGDAAEEICSRGRIPILTGGTGFYIQALLYGVDFQDHDQGEDYRKSLLALAADQGEESLHEMLVRVDPEYAAGVHAHNLRRVIRALEFHHETGEKLSEHNRQMREREPVFQAAYFVLYHQREELYRRINQRVDQMMAQGLEEEVRALVDKGCGKDLQSMQGIGYKEFFPYFEGECSLQETVEQIKQDTRRFAKRQMTWFRREKEVIWLSREESSDQELLIRILDILKQRGIIGP